MTQQLREAAQALIEANAAVDNAHDDLVCCHPGAQQKLDAARDTQAEAERLLRSALSTPPPPAEETVNELMRLVTEHSNNSFDCGEYDLDEFDMRAISDRHITYAAMVERGKQMKAAIETHARQMLLSAQEDVSLFKLLDIAAHHFTEGRYGWPSSETRAALIAHWRAGKEPVPDVFAAMKQQEKP